jgi:hypothetical protein
MLRNSHPLSSGSGLIQRDFNDKEFSSANQRIHLQGHATFILIFAWVGREVVSEFKLPFESIDQSEDEFPSVH